MIKNFVFIIIAIILITGTSFAGPIEKAIYDNFKVQSQYDEGGYFYYRINDGDPNIQVLIKAGATDPMITVYCGASGWCYDNYGNTVGAIAIDKRNNDWIEQLRKVVWDMFGDIHKVSSGGRLKYPESP